MKSIPPDGVPSPRLSAPLRAAGVVIGGLILAYIGLTYIAAPRQSGDLLPLWLAGEAFADGTPVYAPADSLYRMVPPDGWTERAIAAGYAGFVYPFVYPPLWAWVFAGLTRVTDFQTVAAVAGVLNPLLLLLTPVLAWRIAGAGLRLFPYVVISQVLIHMTAVGMIALNQNQAQILVSFLVLLALERSHSGRPFTAGAALALAASIKLFPAVFALLWLASGERRAFAAFAAVGAALGLASLAVAGWPLHAMFLSHVAAIGNTGFFSPLSFSFDSVATRMTDPVLVFVDLADTRSDPGIFRTMTLAEKPAAVALAGKVVLALTIAGFALAMARTGRAVRDGALWPAALAVFPLIGPLAWGYYFISATAFAPVLIARFGWARGGALLCVVYTPISLWASAVLSGLKSETQLIGACLFLILGCAFVLSARRLRVA
ncbi:MAG: DUF2029 domain-containing protein [Rhodobacteraceae bacterium]|nr:DUF2029 domain-containing protein [Paracoccaceae bacterium]